MQLFVILSKSTFWLTDFEIFFVDILVKKTTNFTVIMLVVGRRTSHHDKQPQFKNLQFSKTFQTNNFLNEFKKTEFSKKDELKPDALTGIVGAKSLPLLFSVSSQPLRLYFGTSLWTLE